MTSQTPPARRAAAGKAHPLSYGPKIALPLMALGIAAMVPARLAGLADLLPDLTRSRTEVLAEAGSPAATGRPVVLRGDLVATPTAAAVLAAPVRANPVGEERQADARLLTEVARRQAEIERRERALELREARLQAAEDLARTQMTELTKLREEVERLVVKEGTAAEADIDALVALYVNMRPQQAAKVLERLEAPRAATILLKIPDRQAGPILAQMEPPAALAVTQEIAGRREAFRR